MVVHGIAPYTEHEGTGVLEYWSTGVLEYWSTGVLEYWSTGVLEYWRTGVLEYAYRVCELLIGQDRSNSFL